jgi:ribokinase
VEWLELCAVDRIAGPGEISVARAAWREAAGGGGIVAVVLAELAGSARLLTAIGDHGAGRALLAELGARGVDAVAEEHAGPTGRAHAQVDGGGERAIVVVAPAPVPEHADRLPWEALAELDAVCFTAGDADALRAARRARVLVATARAGAVLAQAGVTLDAVVGSEADPGDALDLTAFERPPRLVVRTRGEAGGAWEAADGRAGAWDAAPLPGPPVDSFACGDAFAAGLTFGLARGLGAQAACELGAVEGARRRTLRGPYGR